MPGTRERWRMSLEARALMIVTAVLVSFGLAVLYSASALQAISANSPGHFFVLRQATGVLAGAVAFAICAKVDADRWRRLAWPIMGLSLLLMLVIILPGTEAISKSVYGSRRYLFNGSLQPSELAKFAVLVWTPMLLVKKGAAVRQLGKGLLPFVVVIGMLSLLAILEPDVSVAMLFCLIMAVLLFVGGARVSHFLLFGVVGMLLIGFQASQSTYIRKRVTSFLANEQESATRSATGDQQYQSFVAVGSGGVAGVGFSQGNQQRGWLPLAYNDFIGSVVGEEFGFLGLGGITLAFALYGWLGFRIAKRAQTPFGALLAIGITFVTVFTAFIHLGVVIGLLPNTGLTLPFVSYGRSNLVLTLAMTGILVNIGSDKERVYGTAATDPLGSRPA
ncbi:MAG: FtsW/RodA/SpoVE family cell cycle protein [Gemmatimonadota bacterium]|jgi:cell division protein FtsW|nr:FtsW/RodA/SpoVE family cell cycle protein [Gemmatimonadota bacterium]MDQ8172337.1 FtsW/RodA/SpoVE family cell cycle protein [Gemmatimonadota bacterium]